VRWRATTEYDVEQVMALEHHPDNSPFVTQWPREEHVDTLRDAGARHMVAVDDDGTVVGFIIVLDLAREDGVAVLQRIVVGAKGRGLGRDGVRQAKRIAFEEHGAKRLWLDVKRHNTRALKLYESEGFVLQGEAPDNPVYLILSIDRP
jgi:ribosomal protein S18 acetylase RimI-like enzyme